MSHVLFALLARPVAWSAPPWSLSGAVLVQDADPRIACSAPWCEGEIVIDASSSEIVATLLNFERYTEIFPRVRSARAVSEGVLHLTMAMPFPLQDRDYVVQMVNEGEELYFEPVPHPTVSGVVRLSDFAGRWILTPNEHGGTVVRYIWHTELGADIPAWATHRTWLVQGNEILRRLKQALER